MKIYVAEASPSSIQFNRQINSSRLDSIINSFISLYFFEMNAIQKEEVAKKKAAEYKYFMSKIIF